MKNKASLEEQIEHTLEMGSTITEVKASPFFKDKMLRQLFPEKEEKSVFAWFTPQLQLATLACFLVVNIYTLIRYNQHKYDETIADFAETYELNIEDTSFIFD